MTESVAVLDEAPGADDLVARRPGLRDFVWLTWRQQGAVLVLTALTVVGLGVLLLLMHAHFSVLDCKGSRRLFSVAGQESPCDLSVSRHYTFVSRARLVLEVMVVGLPLVVAVFWGAPLVSREYEQGTSGLAWGQGATARRWLLGRVAVLALGVLALSVPLWLCGRLVAEALSRSALIFVFRGSRFQPLAFATLAPMLVCYSVLALAIGVLCSVLLRRTLPAIALAALICLGLGFTTITIVRPHYLPPKAAHTAAPFPAELAVGDNPLLIVDNSWADLHGRPTSSYPGDCDPTDATCLLEHGISGRVSVYQPGSREAGFQWIEGTLALLLAAGCLSIAVWRVRPT